jgi:hypothetical protein
VPEEDVDEHHEEHESAERDEASDNGDHPFRLDQMALEARQRDEEARGRADAVRIIAWDIGKRTKQQQDR